MKKLIIDLQSSGIILKDNKLMDNIMADDHFKDVDRSYFSLLIAMGSEYYSEEEHYIFPSDNVWYMDRECIEDHGDYAPIIRRLAELVIEELIIENISDYVDIENQEVWVSFEVNGEKYRFDLRVNDDWVDLSVLEEISKLLERNKCRKRFFFADVDQHVLIVAVAKEQFYRLNDLLNIFIPSHLGEGRTLDDGKLM